MCSGSWEIITQMMQTVKKCHIFMIKNEKSQNLQIVFPNTYVTHCNYW
jgi:hypothetical protein